MNKQLTLEAYQNLLVTYADTCKELAKKGEIAQYANCLQKMNEICSEIFVIINPPKEENKEKKNDKKSK